MMLSDISKKKILEILKEFELTKENLLIISERMNKAMEDGLKCDNNDMAMSSLKMIPTFLSHLPTAKETGRFFSLDIGGTNLRFYTIDISDGQILKKPSKNHEIPPSVMCGKADDLFDFIALKIKDELEALGMKDHYIPVMGFTFSYPVRQISLTSGILIKWTKGFKVEGVVGHNVCSLLKKSCRKYQINIKEFLLMNDTVGTLISGAFYHRNVFIGIINGTGANVAYVEKAANVPKWENAYNVINVIINMELGAFGEHGELDDFMTEHDRIIDSKSINPNQQIFEKKISGMYQGELVRLVLMKLVRNGLFPKNSFPKHLESEGSIGSCILECVVDEKNSRIYEIFKEEVDPECIEIIKMVCKAITIRVSKLIASALYTLIKRIDVDECLIAYDGGMLTNNSFILEYIESSLQELLGHQNFKLVKAEDGSGLGSAIATAVVSTIYYNRNIL